MQFRKLAFALPAVLALVAGQTTMAHAQFTITAVITGTAPASVSNADVQNELNALATDFVLPAGVSSFNLTADIDWENLDPEGALGESGSSEASFQTHTINGISVLVPNPLDRYLYGAASTVDSNAPGYADFSIALNNQADWSTTLATPTDPDAYSLASTLFHESLHSMGFVSDIDTSPDSVGAFGINDSAGNPAPTLFATHLFDQTTGRFLSNPLETDANRLAAITSGNADPQPDGTSGGNGGKLFFSGANALLANGGNMVSMFAPSNLEPGSSGGSHIAWDQAGAELLHPGLFNGEYAAPTNLELAMMSDLGWKTQNALAGAATAPEPSSLFLLLPGALAFGGMVIRRRRSAAKGA